MIRFVSLALAAFALPSAPVLAETTPETVSYYCERGARIPAIYVNDADPALAVLVVEGRLVALPQTRSASGARYAADGTGYLWWIKGDEARLQWLDAETGAVTLLLNDCRAIRP